MGFRGVGRGKGGEGGGVEYPRRAYLGIRVEGFGFRAQTTTLSPKS